MKDWNELTCAGCPAFEPARQPDDESLCVASDVCHLEAIGTFTTPDYWCLPGRRMMAAGTPFDPHTGGGWNGRMEMMKVWSIAKRGVDS